MSIDAVLTKEIHSILEHISFLTKVRAMCFENGQPYGVFSERIEEYRRLLWDLEHGEITPELLQ